MTPKEATAVNLVLGILRLLDSTAPRGVPSRHGLSRNQAAAPWAWPRRLRPSYACVVSRIGDVAAPR